MKKIKPILLSIALVTMLFASSITVLADQTSTQEYVNDHGISAGHGTTINPGAGNYSYTVNYNGTTYYIDDTADQYYSHKMQNSNSTDDVKDQINGMYTVGEGGTGDGINIDVQGGITKVGKAMSGFSGLISILLGFMVTLLTTGMTILTALDLCYIVFPIIRSKCENLKQEGRMVDRGRSEKAGETRLKIISDEAEYAVHSSETVQTGQNPVVIYFKKRAAALIVLSIVIFVLLTGNFTIVINLALKLVSGILEMIQSIG